MTVMASRSKPASSRSSAASCAAARSRKTPTRWEELTVFWFGSGFKRDLRRGGATGRALQALHGFSASVALLSGRRAGAPRGVPVDGQAPCRPGLAVRGLDARAAAVGGGGTGAHVELPVPELILEVVDGGHELRVLAVAHERGIVLDRDVGLDAVALDAPGPVELVEREARHGGLGAVDQARVAGQ